MSEQARKRVALLEALAFADGDQTAEVRLRAVEALQREPSADDEPELQLNEDEAVMWLDLHVADHLDAVFGIASHEAGDPVVDPAATRRLFPLTLDVLTYALEQRARSLADRDGVEQEIRERAERLAADLYVERGLGGFELLLAEEPTGTPAEPVVTPTPTGALPEGLSPDDLTRPWNMPRRHWPYR